MSQSCPRCAVFIRPLCALSASEARWCPGCCFGGLVPGQSGRGGSFRENPYCTPSRVPLACVQAALPSGTLSHCVPGKGCRVAEDQTGAGHALHRCALGRREGGAGPLRTPCPWAGQPVRTLTQDPRHHPHPLSPQAFSQPFDCDTVPVIVSRSSRAYPSVTITIRDEGPIQTDVRRAETV